MIIIPVLKTCEEQINYIFRFDAKIEVGKVYKATEFKNFCCRDIDLLGSMLMTDVATNESWIMPPPIRQNQTGDILWEEKNGVCIGKTEEQIKAIWQEHLSDIGRMEDTSNTASIGERIKKVRKAKGLTQHQFADAVQLNHTYVSKLELGTTIPSDRLIRNICFTFGVSELWLKTGEGDREDTNEQEIIASIGQRIKEVRKAKGLTQHQFAQALGITKSHISNVESGTANPSESLIRTICFTFGSEELWLKTGEGDMAQSEVKGCASNQESVTETDRINTLCAKVDMLIAAIDRLANGRLETPTPKGLLARLKRKMQGVTEIMTPCSGSEEDER